MPSDDAPKTPAAEPDWTDQVADLVVDLVDTVRDKTTGQILKVARGAVYGTVAALAILVMGIIGLAFVGRALALTQIPQWVSYFVIGALFTVLGFALWGKRHAR